MCSRSSSPATLPSRSTTTRSAQRSTSPSRCEMKIDADAVGLQAGDHAQQALGLGDRQARGRLVHDHQARRPATAPWRSRPAAAARATGCSTIASGPKSQPSRSSKRLHAPLQRLRVDQLQKAAGQRLAADEHVRRDVQVLEQVEFLVDEGDAGGHRVVHRQRAALDAVGADDAGVGRDDAAEHLHQRRLAGAVLADQADHLAGRTRQAHGRRAPRHPDSSSGCRSARGTAPPSRFALAAHLPIICFRLAVKASTLDLSITLPGTMMMPSFGTPALLPSR